VKAFKSFFKPIDASIEYDPEQLAMGMEVESEHTPYKAIALLLTKQHLAEDPDYYRKLAKLKL
jgi:hypothetical protein